MVDSIWPKRENEQIFRFFNNDYQLMVGAAKFFSVLDESKDAGVINFQFNIALLHNHVAMKNGGFNMAERQK